ncbi:MAG: hypothetical protein ACRD0U_05145 [Acidimicrobiales bacterium]
MRLMVHLEPLAHKTSSRGHGISQPNAHDGPCGPRRGEGYAHPVSMAGMAPLLDYLRSVGAGPTTEPEVVVAPVDALIADYRRYLLEERGLSEPSVPHIRTKDTGMLQYAIDFNDDASECIVLERYRDSEAVIEHFAHIGDLMEAIVATGSVSGELLGELSPDLRAKMADSEVGLFTPFQLM